MTQCKICSAPTRHAFAVPACKFTHGPWPDAPDDCEYEECTSCGFCFTRHLDRADHRELYDADYWLTQDPEWGGRVSQSLRLLLMAHSLIPDTQPDRLRILDFGCGMGGFVEAARRDLQMDVDGTDIIPPARGTAHFKADPDHGAYDLVLACEVIEHLPDPLATFRRLANYITRPGVIAFQTALYDSAAGRDFWYIGPANGHISIWTPGALEVVAQQLGVAQAITWRDYAGVAAWRVE